MMAINRYRLRHQAKIGNKSARLIERLLAKTDQLIGTILIGNNFVNILATIVAGILASRWLAPYLGSWTELVTAIIVTFIFLVFAEVTPKTLAARKPELIAYPASYLLYPLRIVLMPGVWLIGRLSRILLWPLGLNKAEEDGNDLNMQELRTMVNETGALIPNQYQKLLLNIIDIENMTVEDIMIPRNEVEGIDINDDIEDIIDWLESNVHTRLPVYKDNLNNIIGVLHTRNLSKLLQSTVENKEFTKSMLMQYVKEPYFLPEGTPLHTQLIHFQKQKRRLGVVVDEYGDVQGIIALEDLLEEIVGEFTTDLSANSKTIFPQDDGTVLVDGSTPLRELNRFMGWELSTEGPKTINGLVTEQLQDFPDANVAILLNNHAVIETVHVENHRIRTVRVYERV